MEEKKVVYLVVKESWDSGLYPEDLWTYPTEFGGVYSSLELAEKSLPQEPEDGMTTRINGEGVREFEKTEGGKTYTVRYGIFKTTFEG